MSQCWHWFPDAEVMTCPTALRNNIRTGNIKEVERLLKTAPDASRLINDDYAQDCILQSCTPSVGNAFYYSVWRCKVRQNIETCRKLYNCDLIWYSYQSVLSKYQKLSDWLKMWLTTKVKFSNWLLKLVGKCGWMLYRSSAYRFICILSGFLHFEVEDTRPNHCGRSNLLSTFSQ